MTTRKAVRELDRESETRAHRREWIARKEMRFMVDGQQFIVAVGDTVPIECLRACGDVKIRRLIDNRFIREKETLYGQAE